jgi:isopentenyldiphosphate isomerase
MGRIAVVDAGNRFVRWTDRAEIHARRLLHRSVQILLFDGAGRLVIQRRHAGKLTFPDTWDLSASGHVEEEDYPGGPDQDLDAVYDAVARRELEEELGVVAQLEALATFGPEPGVHYEHTRVYRGSSDGPFRLQPDEVAEIATVTHDELEARLASAPCTPTLRWFAAWMRRAGIWG